MLSCYCCQVHQRLKNVVSDPGNPVAGMPWLKRFTLTCLLRLCLCLVYTLRLCICLVYTVRLCLCLVYSLRFSLSLCLVYALRLCLCRVYALPVPPVVYSFLTLHAPSRANPEAWGGKQHGASSRDADLRVTLRFLPSNRGVDVRVTASFLPSSRGVELLRLSGIVRKSKQQGSLAKKRGKEREGGSEGKRGGGVVLCHIRSSPTDTNPGFHKPTIMVVALTYLSGVIRIFCTCQSSDWQQWTRGVERTGRCVL